LRSRSGEPPFVPPSLPLSLLIRLSPHSKKKLDRMTMHGGDFRQAGKRQGQELTSSYLRALLEDDVRGLNRRKDTKAAEDELRSGAGAGAEANADAPQDLTDEELDRLVDREKVFEVDPETGEYLFPTEGAMFDIVTTSASGGLLALQAVE
jgi:hypothetical protein